MTIDSKLIRAIQQAMPKEANLTEWIASQINRVASIQSAVRDCYQAEQRIEDKAKIARSTEQEKLRAIQATCPHYSTTDHPDPAGGSDSFTRCNICDKEI